MSNFYKVEVVDIPLAFRCLECNKEVKLSVYNVMAVGEPMCCDQEMDLDEYCYFTKND